MPKSKQQAFAVCATVVIALTVMVVSATQATAAPGFVQSTATVARSGNVMSASLPSTTSGNLLVVYLNWNNTSGVTLSDAQNDVFAAATPRQAWGTSGLSSNQVFYAASIQGGPVTVTATSAAAVGRFGQMYLHEYSGMAGVSPVDVASAAKGTASSMSTPNVTTTNANDVLFAASVSDNTVTGVASGYATRSTAYGNRTMDKSVSAVGAYNVSATQNGGNWAMQLVAFKAAAGAPTTTSPSTTTTTSPSTTNTSTSTSSTTTSTTSTSTSTTSTTMPSSMGNDECMFMTFCDNFAQAFPGGRGGDLDESKWSYSRLSQETNPSQGTVNKFVPVNAEFCMTHKVVQADNDSFVCGQEFGEPNHWMEAIYDNGSYVMDSNRALQPFDFANRTGTLDFSVDAKSTGSHGSWVEVWLTADPMQSPHTDKPATHPFPRSGIGFEFDEPEACPGGMTGQQANSLRLMDEFHNYVNTVHTVNSPCFSTQDDMANHFQIKVATDHVEVWASDAGGMNFRQIASVPVALDFTRGYWHLEHAQYNASKAIEPCECAQNSFTYHWHAVSFDGPAVTPDRSYQVPDALRPQCGGNNNVCGVNLGYTPGCFGTAVACSNFTIPNVDPGNASSAALTYDAWYGCCNPKALQVTINGHVHSVPDPNPDAASTTGDAWRSTVLAVPLSELVAGTNTVNIGIVPGSGCAGSCASVANVDLELTG